MERRGWRGLLWSEGVVLFFPEFEIIQDYTASCAICMCSVRRGIGAFIGIILVGDTIVYRS